MNWADGTSRLLRPPAAAAYRADIDGLRAVAVMAVVLFHAYRRQVTGGFVGVDVFFVISGYLISGIIWNDLERGEFSFTGFYARRIRRLFPTLIVVLLASLAYGWFVLLPSEYAALGLDALGGAGFVSNILLWQEAGYFDRAAVVKPLLHLWSLGVEEQFYIVWPFALWLLYRLGLNRAIFLSLVVVSSFVASIILMRQDPAGAFFLPVTRFWEFAAGALIARFPRPDFSIQPQAAANWASACGLLLIVASAALLDETMPFPGWLAVPAVAGTVLILAAGARAWLNRVVLAHPVAVFMGLISYPLYLWHWPLISYAYILRLGKAPRELPALGLIVVSCVLAYLTYTLLERPIRFGGARQKKAAGLMTTMSAVATFGLGLWYGHGIEARFQDLPTISVAKINSAANDPILAPTRDMRSYKSGIVTTAEIGSGQPEVLFAGDSLLFQFGPRVQQLYSEGELKESVVLIAGPSCPAIPGVLRRGAYAGCNEMANVIAQAIGERPVDRIVLGGNWGLYTGAGNEVVRDGKRVPTGASPGTDYVWANLQDAVANWVATGHKVFLILPTPADDRFAPTNMLIRSYFGVQVNPVPLDGVPIETFIASNREIVHRLREIAARTGALVLDPIPDICGPGPTCAAFYANGEPKFVDTLHLRPDFVAHHMSFLDQVLTR
ncbi:MAG: acyltransferase family protein [Rhodopila sp.]